MIKTIFFQILDNVYAWEKGYTLADVVAAEDELGTALEDGYEIISDHLVKLDAGYGISFILYKLGESNTEGK